MEPRKNKAGKLVKISSFSNPIIKGIRTLQRKKERDARGQFLAEGLKLIRDGLDGGWTLDILICTSEALMREPVQEVAARCKAGGGLIAEVPRALMEKIVRRDNPQSVAGVMGQRVESLDFIRAEKGATWIGLHQVRDPGNLGTIIRTSDAAGVNGVVLIGDCCDPFSSEAVRATMGSLFHVPLVRTTEDTFLQWCKSWNGRIVGTLPHAKSDYRGMPKNDDPALILMGNEQAGLSDDLAAICKESVRIPQVGQADSLNLAIATGLMIYEVKRESLG